MIKYSIWKTSTITLGHSRPGSYGKEEVLNIFQSCLIKNKNVSCFFKNSLKLDKGKKPNFFMVTKDHINSLNFFCHQELWGRKRFYGHRGIPLYACGWVHSLGRNWSLAQEWLYQHRYIPGPFSVVEGCILSYGRPVYFSSASWRC